MNKCSQIAKQTIRVIYPYIIIFGLYIIYNGHTSPGGGFQGGAILSSIFIIYYIMGTEDKINLHIFSILEKIFFLLLVVFAVVLVFYLNHSVGLLSKQTYMIIMNILIGLEVFCGFSVIFFRFIYFESR